LGNGVVVPEVSSGTGVLIMRILSSRSCSIVGVILGLVWATGECVRGASEPEAGATPVTIAERWQERMAAIKTLQVVYMCYMAEAKSDGLTGDGDDIPPIDPSINRAPFNFLIYQRDGVKESLESWRYDCNVLKHRVHVGYDGKVGFRLAYGLDELVGDRATVTKERNETFRVLGPHIPFVVCDDAADSLYESLKTGKAKTSPATGVRDAGRKLLVSYPYFQAPEGRESPAGIAVLDRSLSYAPIECKLLVDGKLRIRHRWTGHVELLKDVWLPQECDVTLINPDGKVVNRAKFVVLNWIVNGKLSGKAFERSFPKGTHVEDLIKNTTYSVESSEQGSGTR
jgi:hypothetical protein